MAITGAIVYGGQSIQSIGLIQTIGLQCNESSIDWGNLFVGTTNTHTVKVINNGTTPETLSMVVSNWQPSAISNYLTLTWDQQGTVLMPGQSVNAVLSVYCSNQITQGYSRFSNVITISGIS
jgi:hypothetical protein